MAAPIVLVHGGWLGGWAWDAVAPMLAINGLVVHAPTLIGLGERAAEGTASTNVSDHVDDLLPFIESLGEPITLLGHSYSGAVVTIVADRRPDLIGNLIVLDGFVPKHGERIVDQVDAADAALTARLQAADVGYRPPPDPSRWNITDPGVIEHMRKRLTPQPGGTSLEVLELHGRYEGPATYVSMLKNQKQHFVRTADRLSATPGWTVLEYAGGHLDMLVEPERLADFLSAATRPPHNCAGSTTP